jgi:hypothetical protein
MVVTVGLLSVSCQSDGGLLVPDRGLIPRADARVADYATKTVMIPLTGEHVTLTLDGSHSTDPDGKIAKYRWLSAAVVRNDVAAAGSNALAQHRDVPEGADPSWPDDEVKPEVELGEGNYAFTLWVVDERGLVSAPDTVRVVIARAP